MGRENPEQNRPENRPEWEVRQPLFSLGHIVFTPGAVALLEVQNRTPLEFFYRHQIGDWGDLGEEDWQRNEFALLNEERLFSSYHFNDGEQVWVITERDRSFTTLLRPDEY